MSRGMTVTVVHLMPTVMERQLDESAGYLLKRELESRGLAVLTEANTEAIVGDGKVEAVRLKDGRGFRPTSWSWPWVSGPTPTSRGRPALRSSAASSSTTGW